MWTGVWGLFTSTFITRSPGGFKIKHLVTEKQARYTVAFHEWEMEVLIDTDTFFHSSRAEETLNVKNLVQCHKLIISIDYY